MVVFLFSVPWNKMIEYGYANYVDTMSEQIGYRHEMKEAVRELHQYIEKDDTIGIIYGEESLYYLRERALKYELIPNKVSVISYGSEENLRYWVACEEWDKMFILTNVEKSYMAGEIYKVTEENGELSYIQINQ